MGKYHTNFVRNFKDLSNIIDFNKVTLFRSLNFVTYESDVSMFGTKYDFESILHYPAAAFSKNGGKTITSIEPGGDIIMVELNTPFVVLYFDSFLFCTGSKISS